MLASFELTSDVADRTKHLVDSMFYVHFETFLPSCRYVFRINLFFYYPLSFYDFPFSWRRPSKRWWSWHMEIRFIAKIDCRIGVKQKNPGFLQNEPGWLYSQALRVRLLRQTRIAVNVFWERNRKCLGFSPFSSRATVVLGIVISCYWMPWRIIRWYIATYTSLNSIFY